MSMLTLGSGKAEVPPLALLYSLCCGGWRPFPESMQYLLNSHRHRLHLLLCRVAGTSWNGHGCHIRCHIGSLGEVEAPRLSWQGMLFTSTSVTRAQAHVPRRWRGGKAL